MTLREINSFSGKFEFLSNFSPHPVFIEDIRFPTAEHAFQAMKTTDPGARQLIARLPTPGKAKRVGRQIDLRPDWEDIKLEVMWFIVLAKFRQNTWIRRQLWLTRNAELIEGNHWGDRFWGMTLDNECGQRPETCKWGNACADCREWTGENHLGKILMEVRRELDGR
jgi:N-glycosidase YbiA